jgi:hypothetical protein
MGSINTNGKTIESTYTNRNNHTVSPSLDLEIRITNTLNGLRKDLGLAHTRNAYPWWAYFLAALTYTDNAKSSREIQNLLNEFQIHPTLSPASTLLSQAIAQVAPDPIDREYSKKLPKLVKTMRVRCNLRRQFGRGRAPLEFRVMNRDEARSKMLAIYPNTQHLFDQLDFHMSRRETHNQLFSW